MIPKIFLFSLRHYSKHQEQMPETELWGDLCQ